MHWVKTVLRGIVLTILLLLCAALFYILVIMGGTSVDETPADPTVTQAPLASLPQATVAFVSDDLELAGNYFNAPVLKLSRHSGWQLDSITVTDAVPGMDGDAREVRLRYVDAQTGMSVDVSSITPGTYVRALLDRGFRNATEQNWMLGGLKAVLMQSGETLHLHAQRGDVVYQIEGTVDTETLQQVAASIEL